MKRSEALPGPALAAYRCPACKQLHPSLDGECIYECDGELEEVEVASIERCARGHAIRSYSDVDTYCNRCQIEMPAEIERLTNQLRGAEGILRELAQMPLRATGRDFDRLVRAARDFLPEYTTPEER